MEEYVSLKIGAEVCMNMFWARNRTGLPELPTEEKPQKPQVIVANFDEKPSTAINVEFAIALHILSIYYFHVITWVNLTENKYQNLHENDLKHWTNIFGYVGAIYV